MKCVNNFVIITILVGIWHNIYTSGTDIPPTYCVEESLLDLFTKWRQGDEMPFDLPKIDVIKMQSFEGQYSGYGIKISYETGNMSLFGINNFTVEKLQASANNTLEASGIVNFPLLNLTSDNYSLKGRAYVFYSLKGSMFITFRNVKLMFGIQLVPDGAGTKINDIRLDYSVEGIQINLDGSSWPINKVLNSEAMAIVESYHSFMVDVATKGVTNTLNRCLETVRPDQISDTFVGNCSNNKLN